MKSEISAETLRELLDYNPETGELFWKKRASSFFSSEKRGERWNAEWAGVRALTALNSKGYMHGHILGKKYRAHRVIWCMVYGDWPASQIDHKNTIKTANWIANLRLASGHQNQCNKKIGKNNTSGFKGVGFVKASKRWSAKITVNSKTTTLGYFDTPEQAHAAYVSAAGQMHGDFSRTE